jgi:type III secretion YscU/HrpY family protein
MAEKTEKATPKKLRDAKKKGQVAKSQDLPSAFTFIISIWVVLAMSQYLYDYLGGFVISIFRLIPENRLNLLLPELYYQAAIVIFLSSMPVLVIVSIIGALINFLVVGPMFSFEVFKFDIKKFDPVQNLKQKFKLKTLVELIKSVLKISIASYIIYTVMVKSLPVLIKTVSMPMMSSLLIFNAFLMEVVIKVGLFFIIVAVADFVYQKRNFATEMKMEKFEVKQEFKNTEGDPQIKGRRKQMAQEIAYQEGPSAMIKYAKAVVTNPTHLAVALGYRRECDVAPYILAMGKDVLAERMIKMAGEFGIPVIRNITLAHKLWEDGELYNYIPESTYEIVADILRWLNSLSTDEPLEPPQE